MQTLQQKAVRNGAFSGTRPSRRAVAVRCSAESSTKGPSRRELLASGAALLAASPLIITAPAFAETRMQSIEQLGTFQKIDLRNMMLRRSYKALKEVLTSADAPGCLSLVLHDAGTYDVATKTGGMDGSIALVSDELGRPENAGLRPLVERLAAAKGKVDEEGTSIGQGPISWADLLVIASKVATQLAWREVKLKKASTPSGGAIIADNYAAEWKINLGRIDNPTPGAAGIIPAADAPVEQITAYLKQLGTKPGGGGGPFAPKPLFWERPGFVIWTAASADPAAEEARFAAASPDYASWKAKYDNSRRTLTRTDYEVDYIEYFTKLTNLGAKFDPNAYLFPQRAAIQKF